MKVNGYTRKEIANILGVSEQRVVNSKKIITVYIERRNKKIIKRYILLSDIEEGRKK